MPKRAQKQAYPDEIFSQHIGILGKTGSGKTYTGKVFVEKLLTDGKRVCIIDPTGVWWGLKSSANGKREGFPVVVFGGDHADVEINEHSARDLATIIATENMPAVIDLSIFSKSAIRRFMTKFFEVLRLKNKKALHLIVDEADMFAPQRPMPDSKLLLSEMDHIVRRGRVKGLRVTMISQRPAVIHKDVLTQINTLVIMRLTGPQDRKAVEEWIKFQAGGAEEVKEVLGSLPRLAVGEGWLWAPEFDRLDRIQFPRIETFDSSSTPSDDDEIIEPKVMAAPEIGKLKKLLERGPEEKPKRSKSAKKTQVDERAIFDRGLNEGIARGRAQALTEMQTKMEAIGPHLSKLQGLIGDVVKLKDPPLVRRTPQPVSVQPKPQMENGSEEPREASRAARRVLNVLAGVYPMKLTNTQWATLCGLKGTSGTWSNYKSQLNVIGYVEKVGSLFVCTQIGMDAMGASVPDPKTPQELRDMWRAKIGPSKKLFEVLLDYYPASIAKTDLAEEVDMSATSGTFSNYVSKMVANNIVVRQSDGKLVAARVLFDGGGYEDLK